MRKPLIRRRLWVLPVWLVATLLFSALVGAYLAYFVASTTIVREPLQITEKELSSSIFPGQSDTYIVTIRNDSPVGYTVRYDVSTSSPAGVSFTIKVKTDSGGFVPYAGGSLTMAPDGRHTLKIRMTTAGDTAPGSASVDVIINRL